MLNEYKFCYHGTIKEHGEYIEERGIDLSFGRKATDFGQGFYVTNHLEQAEKWAMIKNRDYLERNPGSTSEPVVAYFTLNHKMKMELEGKIFNKPDNEWADFVLKNRKQGKLNQISHEYDFVLGPLADGKIAALIKRLENGIISLEQFSKGIQPFSDNHTQLSLNKEISLEYIELLGVKVIGSKQI